MFNRRFWRFDGEKGSRSSNLLFSVLGKFVYKCRGNEKCTYAWCKLKDGPFINKLTDKTGTEVNLVSMWLQLNSAFNLGWICLLWPITWMRILQQRIASMTTRLSHYKNLTFFPDLNQNHFWLTSVFKSLKVKLPPSWVRQELVNNAFTTYRWSTVSRNRRNLVLTAAIFQQSRNKLYKARKKMSMFFSQVLCLPDLNVFDNVAFPIREHTDPWWIFDSEH